MVSFYKGWDLDLWLLWTTEPLAQARANKLWQEYVDGLT